MIKRFDLSVAYANRAMAIVWSAVWAIVLFHEVLALKQMIGIGFVVLGTVIVNSDQKKEQKVQTDNEQCTEEAV